MWYQIKYQQLSAHLTIITNLKVFRGREKANTKCLFMICEFFVFSHCAFCIYKKEKMN